MVLKPQPTLKGYNAWVVARLVEAKGITQAEVAAWIIDRWVDGNGRLLADEYGISREHFRRHGKIVQHPSSRR